MVVFVAVAAATLGPLGFGAAVLRADRFLALAPLSIWFLWFVATLPSADHATVSAALGQPLSALLMLAFVFTLFYHAYLGLQVVIEDYVHPRALEITLMVLIRFAAVLAVLSTAIAILRLIFIAAPRT